MPFEKKNDNQINQVTSFPLWQKVIHIASSQPEVYGKLSHETPACYIEKEFFTRIKEDAKTLVVYKDDRDDWIASDSHVFFGTDYNKYYPILFIDLERISTSDLTTLLIKSCKMHTSNTMTKKYPFV